MGYKIYVSKAALFSVLICKTSKEKNSNFVRSRLWIENNCLWWMRGKTIIRELYLAPIVTENPIQCIIDNSLSLAEMTTWRSLGVSSLAQRRQICELRPRI